MTSDELCEALGVERVGDLFDDDDGAIPLPPGRSACAPGCAPARRQGVHRLRRHPRGAAAPKAEERPRRMRRFRFAASRPAERYSGRLERRLSQ